MARSLNSFRIRLPLPKQLHDRYHTGLAVLTGIGAELAWAQRGENLSSEAFL
jgi:hypothetical protein